MLLTCSLSLCLSTMYLCSMFFCCVYTRRTLITIHWKLIYLPIYFATMYDNCFASVIATIDTSIDHEPFMIYGLLRMTPAQIFAENFLPFGQCTQCVRPSMVTHKSFAWYDAPKGRDRQRLNPIDDWCCAIYMYSRKQRNKPQLCGLLPCTDNTKLSDHLPRIKTRVNLELLLDLTCDDEDFFACLPLRWTKHLHCVERT